MIDKTKEFDSWNVVEILMTSPDNLPTIGKLYKFSARDLAVELALDIIQESDPTIRRTDARRELEMFDKYIMPDNEAIYCLARDENE